MEYVYHVVTERPMRLGQVITLGGNYHNGVYNRVTTFFNMINDSDFQNDISDFIKSDMDNWAKVAYREAALEKVRLEGFKNYPSRMACLIPPVRSRRRKAGRRFSKRWGEGFIQSLSFR